MPLAEVNGQQLSYEDTGGDGPPILCLHALLLDGRMFAPQVAALSDVYRVITVDLRGAGHTTSDGHPFSAWDLAGDIFVLLDLLGIERAVLVGACHGGQAALRAALLQPDRVRALALIAVDPGAEPTATAERYRAALAAPGPAGSGDAAGALMADLLGEQVDARPWLDALAALDPDVVRRAGDALIDRDGVADRLDELAMPVLCVHGGDDRLVDPGTSRAIGATASDARGVVEVPGGAHAVTLTHPEAVTHALREFLESLPA